MIVLIAVIFS